MIGSGTSNVPRHVNVGVYNGQWYMKLNNGYKMPMVGYGTWQQTDQALKKLVVTAVKNGYRLIDTARYYKNEPIIGDALQELFKQGVVKRDEIFVATKLHPSFMAEDEVIPALKEQLARLKLDYVDLFMFHWPLCYINDGNINDSRLHPIDPETDKYIFDYSRHYTKAWRGMEAAVRLGLARSIGVSNFNIRQIEDILLRATIRPAVVQIESHPLLANREIIEWCQDRSIAVMAYSPFANPGSKLAKATTKKWPNLIVDPRLTEIASKFPGKSTCNVMLRWQLQRGVVVLPKSMHDERIKSNFNVFDFELSPSDMETINSMDEGIRTCTFAFNGNSSSRDYPFDEIRDMDPWKEGEKTPKYP